ncbi:MAG: glycosyltransferase family 4 protein, partial [Acidimicrobiia bacterium]
MRIAVVCPYGLDRPGGVQRQAVELARRLTSAGHQAWVVAPGREGPAEAILVGSAVGVPFNRSVAPISLDPRAAGRVLREAAQADVVHIHEPLVPVVSLAALAGGTPPKVATFHAPLGRAAWLAYRAAGPLAGRVAVATAVSEVAAQAPRSWGLEPRLVPNGVDTKSFALEEGRHPRRVVFLGRDEPRKGLDVLLQAWGQVRGRLPDAELRVLGARRAGPPPEGVRYLGRVGEDAKRRELARAAVLAAPNLGAESFGLILVEAMAAGCGVVASALPGFREVVGRAGLLVPPGDPATLATTLVRLLGDSSEVQDLGARARLRARHF